MSIVVVETPSRLISEVDVVYVVMKRKPLAEVPLLYRLLARWVYFRIGWASDYSLELLGVYTNYNDAYWAANAPGHCLMALPLNSSLPEETCEFQCHEFPQVNGSARQNYRVRGFETVAVPRIEIERLQQSLEVNKSV